MDDLLSTLSQATGAPVPQTAASAAASAPTAMTPAQAISHLESGGAPATASVSNPASSAQGNMQVLAGTNSSPGFGVRPGNGTLADRSRVGEDYLNAMTNRYGNPATGALAYTWGPGNVDKWLAAGADPSKVPPDKMQYVQRYLQLTGGGSSVAPSPTTPGQSYSGQQAPADSGPKMDLVNTLQSALNAPAPAAKPATPEPAEGMPTKAMTPTTAAQNGSTWSDIAEKGVGNLASSVIGIAGAGARLVGANDFANKAQAARAQIEQQMAADTNNSVAGKVAGVVGGALPYAALGGATIPGAVAGGAVAGAIPAIADNRPAAEAAQGAAVGGALGAGGALAARAIGAVVPAMAHFFGGAAGEEAGAAGGAQGGAPRAPTPPGSPAPTAPAGGGAGAAPGVAGGRGSVGSAGTPFTQQAMAEGVPDAIVQRISAAERAGTLNPTAAERHIEAGSLPVPVELTAGQASGDVNQLSHEMNTRGKNPDLANRFNAQNGQIADNLTALRDQVSPNVNVPSGAPTGQALIDAYKEMDAPIQSQISDLYARARGANGAPALVDAAPQMQAFASQIGPTRFNALPANVQQIFRDAVSNQVSLPAGFEVNGSNFRPMNVGDLMDIDKTLSGAMRGATDGSVRHDIGALRDAIVSSNLNPSDAGADAFAAYRTAQASARARFQAMDADPAYKAAVNDMVPAGEPSPLADDFARKYIAGGKTANVQNMMQNLSNDPVNQELVASALMDHLRAQAGVDLRTGTGNISQAGFNKAIQNLGDKTRIVLGPRASETVERLGNVARYTQQQPRGSFVNNSNTFVAGAASAAKSAAEGVANRAAFGVPVGTWTREALANRANAREVAHSLEPGAGVSGVPLNTLIRRNRRAP